MQSFICPPPSLGKFYSALTTLCCVLLFFNPFVTLAQDCLPDGTLPENIITLPDNVTISSTYPQGATLTNKVIYVNGNASFDRNMTFIGCSVIMGNNASISIEGGNNFSTLACMIKGCSSLWNRILIKSNAFVVHHSTTFMDAKSALEFMPGSNSPSTKIINCNFWKNSIGIQVGNSTNPTMTLFTPGRLSGNVFEGPTLIDASASICGIRILRALAVIGNSGTILIKIWL